MGGRGRKYMDISENQDMRHSARDWRSAISAPLTYRIGSSTLHFRSHLLLAVSLVTAALFTITYLTLTGRNSSNFDHSFVKEHSLAGKYNSTYPFTPLERVGGSTRYRIAIVEDPDKGSRIEQEDKWQSRLKYGYLTISDPPTLSASVSWDKDEVLLSSSLGSGGRGMELSELTVYNGHLVTVDDRTGVVYRVAADRAVPWVILGDGDGSRSKGLKAEWATVRDGELWVGGLGKEWTTPQGELASYDPMWVKVIGRDGQVRHVDWSSQYRAVRAAAGVTWPGYMIHEAVLWSQARGRWCFLPRRLGKLRYDDVKDERQGTNLLITADPAFSDITVSELGPLLPTHGFSSAKFLPGSKDSILVALKSEEVSGVTATFLTVVTMEGRVVLKETKVADAKFEGIEFV